MTLKELRIFKGLNQKECAKYLGMSVRNYQNYEYNKELGNTAKYNAIYKKLEDYREEYEGDYRIKRIIKEHLKKSYNTNIVTGTALTALTSKVKKYKKRDCFIFLEKYIKEDFFGKICILYGLRRTGKTTLLFQMINELPLEETVYIKIQPTDNMKNLIEDLDSLLYLGYKYIFIDEITLMDDFINASAILSDIFSTMGMKIVVSGTDSLGFNRATRDELYDRNIMIHTSYIPFKEFSRILDINSIDMYIEYGGTLKIENMDLDDSEVFFDEVSFRDDESTRKYIDTAISRNIQRTLKNDSYGEYFNKLRILYEKNELTNVINLIVQNMNHQFLLRVVIEKFKSSDLGSSKELLLHEYPQSWSTVLYDIDEEKVIERLKKIIEIKEKDETSVVITDEHIDQVKSYLEKLDLLIGCIERYEDKGQSEIYIITQPGMRYAITKALVYSLLQDEYFKSVSERDKQYIITKILNDVKERMLEDLVLLEKSKYCSKYEEVFKFKFTHGGEFDMVIYNKMTNTCRLYEIKHSMMIHESQTKNLRDFEKCDIVSRRFGKIVGKYVLFRGESKKVDEEIEYINVEEFLV